MATKTGELREMLVSCIEDVRSGKMLAEDAKAISCLTAQINTSLQVELAYRLKEATDSKPGCMPIGEEN